MFLDICVDVSQIEPSQAHEMNLVAQKYGLLGADYFSFLTQDFEEAESLRQARKQEEEKAMYSVNSSVDSKSTRIKIYYAQHAPVRSIQRRIVTCLLLSTGSTIA